ncbi:MAG TPA: ABC transporter ATP-binding protein [Candidatus Dormibacteraeota bacterium]|nr:ABC transporter ATP-binding protein [Candidatus Dormibacteraeota bacterium]
MSAVLEVTGVHSGYGQQLVLRDASMRCETGQAIAIIGPNGAGKSTLLKTICGIVKPAHGTVTWQGRSIGGQPSYRIVARGISLVQEGRALFWNLTVLENLRLGGELVHRRDRAHYARRLEEMFELFPTLAERRHQRAGTLSGGEQQMLAIARVLIREPQLLMLDEPSLGLAPIVIERIYQLIATLKSSGMALIIVEPQPQHVMNVVDRVIVLDRGRIVENASRAEFAKQADDLIATYLGGKRQHSTVG